MTNEYELLPADELARLRREIEVLRANPFGDSERGKTLLHSVDQLNATINRLIKVFSDVEQEMAKEYEKVKTVDEQFKDVREQNKKIASGILAVAQMVQRGGAEPDFTTPDLPSNPPVGEKPSSAVKEQPLNLPMNEPVAPSAQPQPQPFTPSLPQDPFAANRPAPLPVDPWQPQPSQPFPSQRASFPQDLPSTPDTPPPFGEQPFSEPFANPPLPPPKKKGLFR